MSIDRIKILEFACHPDRRGNLTPVEWTRDIPYEVRRAYWLWNIPEGSERGGHSHRECSECLVALSGSFDVTLDDGNKRRVVRLDRADRGLLIPTGIWRELDRFSADAVCLVLASHPFDEADYIRDYETFIREKERKSD